MKRILLLGVLALTMTPAARAQVVVRAPGVYVEVGPAVIVRAFGVQVIVPRRAPAPRVMPPAAVDPAVPPVPAEEERLLPAPKVVPPAKTGTIRPVVDPGVPPVPREEDLLVPNPKAAPKPPAGTKAISLGDFVAGAKPFKPGAYDVVLVHPYTNKPVNVIFELPVAPRRVNVTKTRIDFRWGLLQGVSVYFNPDGTVEVKGA